MSKPVYFTLGALFHFVVGLFFVAMFLTRLTMAEPLRWYNWGCGAYGLWHLAYALHKKTKPFTEGER